LEFKHVAVKETGLELRESRLIVQALRALGKDHVSQNVIRKISDVFCQAKFPEIITENSRFLTREFPDYYRPPGRLIKTAKNRYFPPLNPSIPMLSANLMNSIDSQEDQPHTISLAVLSESHTGL
jgi:hypothetical protein